MFFGLCASFWNCAGRIHDPNTTCSSNQGVRMPYQLKMNALNPLVGSVYSESSKAFFPLTTMNVYQSFCSIIPK